ncbi:MAG TPA: DEAD/DEAH box helicase [Euzebyales bacterium]|nr:DEAD/DEAH box helicase [Euzebyales bacterium]
MTAVPAGFAAAYGFAFDDFQVAGIEALEAGRSVLVAAPTGSGKTVIGEFATWSALRDGGKCFYTTPIKALSNQKYADLSARYGAARVGLLTGDRSINGEAPIVVMTTEVLRNMLYEQSATLGGLRSVVLDEVHYLADRERGAVWEEVIIQLPAAVQLACLSGTVSNAEEFGAWLSDVRLQCEVVISEQRPVPLDHHYAIGRDLHPMFRGGRGRSTETRSVGRRAGVGVPNPDVVMLERQAARQRRARGRRGGYAGVRLRPPRRSELVEQLARRDWLPAIVFVFSRAGCDQAVGHLVGDGVRLTTDEERAEVRRLSAELTAETDARDLQALGFDWLSDALEHGIACHHAGMVPVLKELVEALFVRGLVKVCFATETLALGINMPARTVAIEQLEKWDGQQHELLTPGQFAQLTGRAGRRGLDIIGHVVVSYQRQIQFPAVAALVGQRVEPLRSSFTPTYNMAVNLLRRRTLDESEALLAQSFAQYQATAAVARSTEKIAENREALAGYAEHLVSDSGDVDEYLALRRELRDLERSGAKQRRQERRRAVLDVLEGLAEGDVVTLADDGVGAVVGTAGSARAQVVTDDRRLIRLHPQHYQRPPVVVGRIDLPPSGGPRQSSYRRSVAEALAGTAPPTPGDADHTTAEAARAARIEQLQAAVRDHPVHADDGRAEIERWASRYDELDRATRALQHDVDRRTGSLARELRRIVSVLTELGYLEGAPSSPRPTPDGLRLAKLYADADLLLAECVRSGMLDDLDGPDLAAVISVFTHETRARDAPPVWYPSPTVEVRVGRVGQVWEQLADRERSAGLDPTRAPDAGLAAQVWQWAQGDDLDDVLTGTALTGGDLVRGVRQIVDLCRQLGVAYADAPLGTRARRVADQLWRGVVAAA